jgi:hypothetical protein
MSKIIGLAVGSGVGLVAGTFASIYYSQIISPNGPSEQKQLVYFVTPIIVGGYIGYHIVD